MSDTPLTWPVLSRRPSEWSWKLVPNTQAWTSPLNGSVQTLELPGSRWWCKIGYERLREDDWRIFSAFLARMRGMAGRVLLAPIHSETQRGAATGTPVVSGGGQTGRSLLATGWTPGAAQILRLGDYFSVPTASGPELKIITEDIASNGSGQATLKFEPPLRSAPAGGAAITVQNPVCPMRLADSQQGDMALSSMRYGSFALELVEAWL